MKTAKRILIAALLLALSASLAVSPAFAAEGPAGPGPVDLGIIESIALALPIIQPACKIGSTNYLTLASALDAAVDGNTIVLLKDITYGEEVATLDRDLIFDLNGHTLDVVNDDGAGLDVGDGSVGVTGMGSFNVTGTSTGVFAVGEGSATVTNARATGANGTGVYAESGASVTVRGDAVGGGSGSGVIAYSSDTTVTVHGDVRGYTGARTDKGGRVTVKGDVHGVSVGAAARGSSRITIDGTIHTEYSYVLIGGGSYLSAGNYTTPTTKAGYRTYTDGESTIWVKMAPGENIPQLPLPGESDPTPLAAPTNIKAVAVSSTEVKLTWQDNSSDETEFQIMRWDAENPLTPIASLPADTTSYTDAGLKPATTYAYVVAAVKGNETAGGDMHDAVQVTTPAATPTPVNPPYIFPFADVADGAWYRGDVETAHKSGLINGKTATAYAPDDNMTIAEAIKLAACMRQLYDDGAVTLENGSPWYSTYVSYALENGIIDGAYPNYSAQITRREFVHIFYHALPVSEYAEKNAVAENAIPDVKSADTYSAEIYRFYRAGILTGSDANGTFHPASNIRRSEVAAILTRMFDETARKSITLS